MYYIITTLHTHRGLAGGIAPQQEHLGLGLELLRRELLEAEALEQVLFSGFGWEKGVCVRM